MSTLPLSSLQETCVRVEALAGRSQEAVMRAHTLEGIDLLVRTLKSYCSLY